MAKTAQTMVSDALRWIGVLEGEETATAAELVSGLDALNGMMHGFGPRGIAYAHVNLAATDTVNVPEEQVRNVMFLLGNELAPEYEVALSEGRMAQVIAALQQLQAAYHLQEPAVTDAALRPRWFGRYSNVSRVD